MEDSSPRPLVAVVTPVYNGGAYLEATMRCVQRQTYDRLVHVLVDNCSSDNTPEIIDQFRSQRVELIVSRNNSVLPAQENWSTALCAVPAGTTYIKILCADDLMRSDCIARFVEIAETDERIEVVLCDDVFADRVRRASLPTEKTVFDGIEVAGRMLDSSINWLPYHHMFVRFRDEDRGAAFFGSVPIIYDLAAVVRCTLRGKFAYLREPLVYTRWHAQSITSQYMGAGQLKILLARFDLLCLLGARCWDGPTFRKNWERMRERLIRMAAKWMAMGRWDLVPELFASLKERQAAPGVADCIRSIAKWAPYAIWKRSWRLPVGPEINEVEFLAENFQRAPDAPGGAVVDLSGSAGASVSKRV